MSCKKNNILFCDLPIGTVFKIKTPLFASSIFIKTIANKGKFVGRRLFSVVLPTEIIPKQHAQVYDVTELEIEAYFYTYNYRVRGLQVYSPSSKVSNELIHYLTQDYYITSNPLHSALNIKSTKLLNWLMMK